MRLFPPKALNPERARILFFSSVGAQGKPYLKKLVHRFRTERPDMRFLIVSYDGTTLDDLPGPPSLRLIHEQGFKFGLAKKYISDEVIRQFDLVFVWDDDLDVQTFSLGGFLEIFCRHKFELAQPALTPDSAFSHEITLQRPGQIGRKTDFVEIMAPVFRAATWKKFSAMITPDIRMGWGLDLLARSYCKIRRMGIIDATPVRHARPVQSHDDPRMWLEMETLLKRHRRCRPSDFRNLESIG